MSGTPLISVVTATRNRTDLLDRALRSIASQEYSDYEAVVVDDGSDLEIQECHQSIFGRLPSNFRRHQARPAGSAGAGPGSARNAGIRLARGKYLAFLDDDDWWVRSDHLSTAAKALESAGADFFFANMQGMKGESILWPDWFANSPALTRGPEVMSEPPVHRVSLDGFLRVMRNHFSHPDCWVVRRDLVEGLGGFWDKVRIGEDYDLLMRLADRVDFILYRPAVVTAYRFPEGNSVSLTLNQHDENIQLISSAVHAQLSCRRRAVRRCARLRQSWHLRQLSAQLVATGEYQKALPFAWQGLTTYPSAGGVAAFARTLFHASCQRVIGQ